MTKKTSLLILNISSIIAFSTIAILVKLKYLKSLDIIINDNINRLSSPFLDKLMLFFTKIGDPYTLSTLFALVLIFLLYKNKQQEILSTITSAVLGFLILTIIKKVIERSRPENAQLFESTFSFPSAHATMSTIFFLTFALLFSKYSINKKIPVWIISISIFLSISFSRVYLNVHYLSDILAGIFLAIFCISASLLIFPNSFSENKNKTKQKHQNKQSKQ